MAGGMLIDGPLAIPPAPSPTATDAGDNKAIAFLVTGFTVVTALVAAVGASPGTVVDRALKNEPVGMTISFGLVILSIGLAVAAYNWPKHRVGLVAVSLLLFSGGLLLLAYLLTAARIEKESPTIRASLKIGSGITVEATAKAAGLKADDQMFVYVWGLRVVAVDDLGEPTKFATELLYTSRTGPDRGGAVDLAFEIPLPLGRYFSVGIVPISAKRGQELSLVEAEQSCPKSQLELLTAASTAEGTPSPSSGKACLVMRVPPVSPRPQIIADIKAGDLGTHTLSVRVKAFSEATGQPVLVRVVGLGPGIASGHQHRIGLYNALLGTDASGSIDESFEIPVDPRVTVVCLEAAPLNVVARPSKDFTGTGPLACPTRVSSLSSVVRIPLR
jgi:hypothetical protein